MSVSHDVNSWMEATCKFNDGARVKPRQHASYSIFLIFNTCHAMKDRWLQRDRMREGDSAEQNRRKTRNDENTCSAEIAEMSKSPTLTITHHYIIPSSECVFHSKLHDCASVTECAFGMVERVMQGCLVEWNGVRPEQDTHTKSVDVQSDAMNETLCVVHEKYG